MKHTRRITDIREYHPRPEEDRLKAIDIIERHFPEIGVGEVKYVSVEHNEGYAIVKIYRYAKWSATDPRRYIDERTGEVAMLPVIIKSFPESGLLSP